MFNVIALNADWWWLRSEGVRLQEAMAALYLRTFPNEKQIVDPLVQMRQKVARARQSGGELVPDDFLAFAAALGDAWGTVADPRAIAALDYRDGTLNLRLKPGAQVTLETIRPALAARRIEAAPSPADPAVWQIRSAR
jgi:general secretion pathway protein L